MSSTWFLVPVYILSVFGRVDSHLEETSIEFGTSNSNFQSFVPEAGIADLTPDVFYLTIDGGTNVLVYFYHTSSNDELLHNLSAAFSDEPSVKIAKMEAFRLQDVMFRGIYKPPLNASGVLAVDKLSSLNIPLFVLFKMAKPDRDCLLSPLPEIKYEIYDGPDDLPSLIDFVNSKCNLDRTTTGQQTPLGMLKSQILYSVFRNEEEGSCHRISAPINEEEFLKDYVLKSKPVIITNGLDNWDAMTKWSNRYLKEKFGGNSVHVKVTPDGQFEGCENIDLWEDFKTDNIPPKVTKHLKDPDLVVVRPADVPLSFDKFMNLLESNISASFYLEYCSIGAHLPEMLEDIKPIHWASFFKRELVNVWLGNGKTVGKLHFDPFDNLLCQIDGSKKVTLYHPFQNENLYEGHIREAELDYDLESGNFSRKRLLQSLALVMSPVDINSPDLKRFPKFEHVKPYHCTINSGEILFLPAFWWHEVASVPHNGRNIAVNEWYTPFLTKEYPCANCPFSVNPFYSNILQKLVN